eukprot:sb/3463718/
MLDTSYSYLKKCITIIDNTATGEGAEAPFSADHGICMADDWSCWVAVVGLPSATTDEQIGPGKSCLCNRFVRPHQDDYSESHPSGISNQDYGGSVINNDNFLYWGHVSRTVDHSTIGFKIIEHTQFYDDNSLKPFCNKSYDKRALTPQISTHGVKHKYIDYDNLADQNKSEHSELEKFPDKVVVDCFLFVFDVSREDIYFVNQFTLLEMFMKKAKKPLVVALTKYDSFKCKHIETLRQNIARSKVPVVEVSAELGINVDSVFHVAARLCRVKKHGPRTIGAIQTYEEEKTVFDVRRGEISRLYNSLMESTVINAKVNWMEFKHCCKNHVDFQNFCHLNGTRKAKALYERHRRSVITKQVETRRNVYLKDLHCVFEQLIDSLGLSDYPSALEHIRSHAEFPKFFVTPSEETQTWKEAEIQKCPTTDRVLIPFDLLQEQEARTCFDQRIAVLQAEQDQQDLAEEFEKSLTQGCSERILPGQTFESVLEVLGERFSVLEPARGRKVYEDHQHLIRKQFTQEFEEMLLENTELFRAQLPG